ncbi:hypothetical protein FHS15_000867 [Paenibacillus castaneae]|uniref:hypothetical protein n=1 Tax=Paenibacillus castaneae TaxID=474957 RepID=UPI000C9AEBCE|nr:hypothetical protein [Paenibacillus castaneae]NIK75767.1 hypothetical protein [Paenibacillus castaneae]
MNQLSQQPGNYQGQQSFLNQGNQFEPTGFVQSHYQGQLSQPTFGRQTNSIVSNTPGGYQASNSYSQGAQHYTPSSYNHFSQPVGTNNSFNSHQPVQSYAQSPATAFGSVGPVIAHVGYQAGPDNQHNYHQPQASHFGYGTQYSQQAGSGYGGQSHSMGQMGQYSQSANQYGGQSQSYGQQNYGGMTPTHSNTSIHPVYEATNAYQQAGPVISQIGWQANSAAYSGGNR